MCVSTTRRVLVCGSIVPLVTAPTLVDETRELVPVTSGTRTLGGPLAMEFPMADRPPAPPFHNINYVHSWSQDSVAAQQKTLDKNVDFSASDFGGAHSAVCLMI
jgi:hypothetical protein